MASGYKRQIDMEIERKNLACPGCDRRDTHPCPKCEECSRCCTCKCEAHFSKREGTDNIRGSPGRFKTTPCSRRPKERVGKLHLCTQHARLAREGFVDEGGNVENPNTIADCKRYGIHPPNTWAKES